MTSTLAQASSEHQRKLLIGSIDQSIDPTSSPRCGDVMKLQIRVDDKGMISDVKFKTFGCGSAIASSSYMTERVKGLSLEEAEKIKNTEIAKELCLPPVKLHCSSASLCPRFALPSLIFYFLQCLLRMPFGQRSRTTAQSVAPRWQARSSPASLTSHKVLQARQRRLHTHRLLDLVSAFCESPAMTTMFPLHMSSRPCTPL